jgi:hypothetical protein
MTNARKKMVDPNQMSLLDLLQQEQAQRAEQTPGRMCVSARLQAAIKYAIKQAPKSRETLADEMTDLVGAEVTVHQINNWTSESHPHRIPAELIPAFCTATGCNEPLRVLAEATGVYTLPGPDALRAEVQKLREEEQKVSRERKRRETFLRELEGGLS